VRVNPIGVTLLCLSALALSACGAGVSGAQREPITTYVEIRPQMTADQAAEPQPCAPPLAENNIELLQEDQACSAHADRLVDWIKSLQALIRGQ
jgi:hypothetical protein